MLEEIFMIEGMEGMFQPDDLIPSDTRRWVETPVIGSVHLMQGGTTVEILPEDTLPRHVRMCVRAWVDRGVYGPSAREEEV